MSRVAGALWAAGLSLPLGLSLLANLPTTGRVEGEKKAAKCCYVNPGYAGVCVVEPAEGETCESILAYLNNPQSSGKGYCANTKIRGGWKQISCEDDGDARMQR